MLLRQQLNKAYKVDIGCQTDNDCQLEGTLLQNSIEVPIAAKIQVRNYMKKQNRQIKTKQEESQKKLSLLDKFRKQELPGTKAEKKQAEIFMKGANAQKASK